MEFLTSCDAKSIVSIFTILILPILAALTPLIYRWGTKQGAKTLCAERQVALDKRTKELTSCTESKSLLKIELGRKIEDLKTALQRYDAFTSKIRASIENNQDVWNFHEKIEPENYFQRLTNGIPIVVVASLKGGVGKTTVSDNLAAFFDEHLKKRVLLIDLDYQSSTTSTMLAAAGIPADKVLDKLEAGGEILKAERSIEDLSDLSISLKHEKEMGSNQPPRPVLLRTDLIATSWSFGNLENSLMLNWLFNDNKANDIRYNLAKFLLDDTIQKKYDIVIIDAPPRMTTGFMNALCTSTHILIPANLDRLASQAVRNLLDEMRLIRPQLFPALQPLGVLATLTAERDNLKENSEKKVLNAINGIVSEHFGTSAFVFNDVWLPKKADIAKAAGEKVAYLEYSEIRDIFIKIGEAIQNRVKA